MTWHGVDRDGESELRDLLLVLELEPDVDPDVADQWSRQLRAELKDLDVECVTPVTAEDAPPSAKGADPMWGALLITLSTSGGVFPILMQIARDWLARHAAARRISVTIDGDTIVLEKGSTQERSALIDAYMRRHEVE